MEAIGYHIHRLAAGHSISSVLVKTIDDLKRQLLALPTLITMENPDKQNDLFFWDGTDLHQLITKPAQLD